MAKRHIKPGKLIISAVVLILTLAGTFLATSLTKTPKESKKSEAAPTITFQDDFSDPFNWYLIPTLFKEKCEHGIH